MTWTCWAIVNSKEIWATGVSPEDAKEMYFHDCTWRGQQKPWEWHVEKYNLRVIEVTVTEKETTNGTQG